MSVRMVLERFVVCKGGVLMGSSFWRLTLILWI